MLDPLTAMSWRDLGVHAWSAISSRIVFVHLQLCLSDSNKLNVSYHYEYLCPYPLGIY